jgi:hypothetical protein
MTIVSYSPSQPGLILNPNLAITFNVPSLLESIAHEFRGTLNRLLFFPRLFIPSIGKKINNPVAAVMLFDLAARYFEEKFQVCLGVLVVLAPVYFFS